MRLVPQSLRARLTLAFVVVAGVAVVVSSVATAALLERSVWGPLDAALHEEVETILAARAGAGQDGTGGLAGGVDPELDAVVSSIAAERDLGPEKFVRVDGPGREPLARAGVEPPATALAGLEAQDAFAARTISDPARGPVRVACQATRDGGRVIIGVGARHQEQAVRRGVAIVWGTSMVLLAVLAAVAWAITSRATGELERLSSELEGIEAASLERRIEPKATSEVSRLADVVNRLLVRLQRAIEQLREFTADAAHELRTPLATLRARVEIAVTRQRSAEEYRAALIDALEHLERLERLSEDLLTLHASEARPSSAAGASVDLTALAGELGEFLEPVAQEQGRAFSFRADDDVVVPGSAPLLKRVLLNLLDNAFRHTRRGVSIALDVRREGEGAVVRVSDAGDGMTEVDAKRAFERFYRGRNGVAGSGLGLAICREIVARHGGQIDLDTRPGSGTTVTVRLPRTASDPSVQ
jgi:signal transduction histidine kinase